MRVLLLSCSTGEGHNSAARALSEALNDLGVENEILDPIGLKNKKVRDLVSNSYNKLIQKAPIGFGMVYSIGHVYSSLPLPSPVYYANTKYVEELYNYIKDNKYDKVICTHLYCMLAMTEINKRYEEKIPCYGVLTDYTIIPFFKDAKLDGYFVPTEDIKEEFINHGIDKNLVHVTGIPVSKKFSLEISKDDAKKELGIPNYKKIVTLMSGGVGCGNILKISQILEKELDESYSVCVLVGKNDKLKTKLETEFGNSSIVKPIGFTSEVYKYLKSSEVVLSKPGGLSSSEIAVSNTPFIHLKEIPGCESANIKYFTSKGISMLGRSNEQIIKSVKVILNDDSVREEMIKNQTKYIKKDSSKLILDVVLG